MTDEQIAVLADSIYRDRVLRARKLSIGERIKTGFELFEDSLAMMREGIRNQFPDVDENEVEEILKKRLHRLKQVHEHGLYRKAG